MGLFGFGKKKVKEESGPKINQSVNRKSNCSPQELYEEGIRLYNADENEQAAELFLEAAEAGYTEAQRWLGLMYNQGLYFEKDDKKAAFWYEEAAKQGHAEAQNDLAALYEFSTSVKDYEKALYWYNCLLEGGQMEAAYSLGLMYSEGKGCTKNMEKALGYWCRGAELGEVHCLEKLGDYYRDLGQVEEALKWYRMGEQGDIWTDSFSESIEKMGEASRWRENIDSTAAADSERAYQNAADLYEEGEGFIAYLWMRAAAENGHVQAQYELAWMLAMDEENQDIETAIEWAQKAADAGHEEAADLAYDLKNLMVRVVVYEVKEDYEHAFKLRYVQAIQGDAEAQLHVGEYYRKGQGVEKDLDKAESWYCRAMKQGAEEAPFRLGAVYFEQCEYDAAIEMFRIPAEKGNPQAMYNIAVCCRENGLMEKAEEWWLCAAEKGHQGSMWNLSVLYCEKRKYKQAKKWALVLKEKNYPDADMLLDAIARG